jgi:hypothetical protein
MTVKESKEKTGRGGAAKSVLMDNLDVCELLGVRPDTWRKRINLGIAPIPHSRAGARGYYKRADVRAYIKTGQWPAGMKFRNRKPEDGAADGASSEPG